MHHWPVWSENKRKRAVTIFTSWRSICCPSCADGLAGVAWKGCRAGGDNTGGQDANQWSGTIDTPPTFHPAILFYFGVCVEWSVGAEAPLRGRTTVQIGPGNNQRQTSARAQWWQKPLIPEDIYKTLQVILVTSQPVTRSFLLHTDDSDPMSPCFCSSWLTQLYPANCSGNIKLKSYFVLQVSLKIVKTRRASHTQHCVWGQIVACCFFSIGCIEILWNT